MGSIIIVKYDKKPIESIYQHYEDKKTIDEYLEFLKEKETFFLSTKDESKMFPKLNIQWDYPSKITNSIIELSQSNCMYLETIIEQLIELGCYYIQIFTVSVFSIEFWNTFLKSISHSPIKLIDIFTQIDNNCDISSVKNLVIENARLKLFYIHSSIDEGIIKIENDNVLGRIYQSKKTIDFNKSCGTINHHYFNVNIELFTESHHFNNCLNRKIAIDMNGDIKNCPGMNVKYGNIKNTSLEEVIRDPGFKDLWYIRKDDIDVCKDCEFRYMCTDCRVFIRNQDDIYSQPYKCPYNPYIAKWEGEEGYISVEKWRAKNPNWGTKVKRQPVLNKS